MYELPFVPSPGGPRTGAPALLGFLLSFHCTLDGFPPLLIFFSRNSVDASHFAYGSIQWKRSTVSGQIFNTACGNLIMASTDNCWTMGNNHPEVSFWFTSFCCSFQLRYPFWLWVVLVTRSFQRIVHPILAPLPWWLVTQSTWALHGCLCINPHLGAQTQTMQTPSASRAPSR